MKTRNIAMMVAAVVLMLGFAACQKAEMDPGTNENPNSFTVRMTDSPGDYEGLEVEITSVQAFHAEDGWVELNSESRVISVLELTNGRETFLVNEADVSSGDYTKLKIVYGDENRLRMDASLLVGLNISGLVVVDGMAIIDLQWNGPKETVIDIDRNVSDEQGAEVLLDFNVAQSVEQNNDQYTIDPVVYEIEDKNTGVHGQVKGVATAVVILSDGSDTWSTYIDAQGYFLFRGMEEGTYDMTVKPCECELEPGMDQEK